MLPFGDRHETLQAPKIDRTLHMPIISMKGAPDI
jgi:hypothetical protein